jgi:hypothetical protein
VPGSGRSAPRRLAEQVEAAPARARAGLVLEQIGDALAYHASPPHGM